MAAGNRTAAGTNIQQYNDYLSSSQYHPLLHHQMKLAKYPPTHHAHMDERHAPILMRQVAPPRYHHMDMSDHYPYSPYASQQYEGGADATAGDNERAWSRGSPGSGRYPRMGGAYIDPHQPRLVEVKRNAAGSLGISLGQAEMGGVVINAMSPACQSMTKGLLNLGDKILEVSFTEL